MLLGALSAHAEVPQQLHYNGYLTNAVGDPVDCPDAIQCDAEYDLTFRLYGSPDEGAILWEESHSGVPLFNGTFSLLLGNAVPMSSEVINGSLWLGVKVNEQPEMTPRQKVVSAAFALRAAQSDQAQEAVNASQLGGMNPGDYATQNTVIELQTSLSPVATDGLPEDLADGDDDTLGSMTCGVGMVPKVSSFGTWTCANDEAGADMEDTTLSESQVDDMVANNGYAAQTELEAAQAALTELQNVVNSLDTSTDLDISNIQTQLTALETALTAAQSDLAAETTARENADNAEATARAAKDSEFETSLGTEITARVSGDETLQANIDALDASLSPIAKGGLPPDLADGDDNTDTLAALSCADGQVAQRQGETWVCATQTTTQLETTEPAPCDESAKGTMYLDEAAESLRICDGTEYRKVKICSEVCPPASTVMCNLPVEDNCGSACGGTGTALNPSLCADASTVACGGAIQDECGNTCSFTGTATNSDQCSALVATTICGTPVNDNCGNSCGTTGTFCADALQTCTDGTCTDFSQACGIKEAEHPSATTVARDVALCGNRYSTSNIDTACAPGWSVCTLSQWDARYPKGSAPGGTLSSFGDPQSSRMNGVWNAGAPTTGEIWNCSPSSCDDGYNPWNSGKFLYNDAKTAILSGSGGCCSWDTSFTSGSSSQMAVYCCRD